MSLEITFLGHSGFLLSDRKTAPAIDPFLTGNPLAKQKPADIRCQHIAVTHGHAGPRRRSTSRSNNKRLERHPAAEYQLQFSAKAPDRRLAI